MRIPFGGSVATCFLGTLLLAGCAEAPHRLLLPYKMPTHALTLAQIVVWVPRERLVRGEAEDYKLLMSAGIPDTDIQDKTMAIGRINCCYQDLEVANAIAFHVPPTLGADLMDVVEIRVGQSPGANDEVAEPNQATRVVQKRDTNGACRWEPPQSGPMKPYGSVIYCDWMRSEGWVAEGPAPSIYHTWIRKQP